MHVVVGGRGSDVVPALWYATKMFNCLTSILRHNKRRPCAVDTGYGQEACNESVLHNDGVVVAESSRIDVDRPKE
jgi:hypothetical protein